MFTRNRSKFPKAEKQPVMLAASAAKKAGDSLLAQTATHNIFSPAFKQTAIQSKLPVVQQAGSSSNGILYNIIIVNIGTVILLMSTLIINYHNYYNCAMYMYIIILLLRVPLMNLALNVKETAIKTTTEEFGKQFQG